MSKNLTIILDAAHGEETPGKRSPDGKFREYKWSRDRIKELTTLLKKEGFEVFESNPSNKEIGLSKRAENANKISRSKKVLISLHVNAAGNGVDWMTARGYSVYTTKGKTNSDKVAEIILQNFIKDFPELRGRFDKSDGDLDQEENFTVIYKANCPAVLVEWLFQDNKEDVELLQSEEVNKRFTESLFKSILTISEIL